MDDQKMYGPWRVKLSIMVTDGDQLAEAGWDGPVAQPITLDYIKHALKACEEQIKETLGEDWRLCTKEEFFNELVREKTGANMKFAPPGGPDWDAVFHQAPGK